MLARQARCLLLGQHHGSSLLAAVDQARQFSSTGAGSSSSSSAFDSLSDVNAVLETADAVVTASRAAELATVAAAKAQCWTGTQLAIDMLSIVHDSLHLPWWGAILAAGLAVRAAMAPVTVGMQYMGPKGEKIRKESQHVKELMTKRAMAPTASEYLKLSEQVTQAQSKLMDKKWERRMVMLMPVVGIFNGAVMISQFSAVSTLAAAKVPSFTYEGLGWFMDLTAPDPIFGLPLACALTTLLITESGALTAGATSADPKTMQTMLWVGRAGALMTLPIGYFTSSAVGVVWVSNGLMQFGQAAALKSPTVRRWLRLPEKQASASGDGSSIWKQLQDSWGISPAPAAATAAGSSSSSPARLVTTRPKGVKVRVR